MIYSISSDQNDLRSLADLKNERLSFLTAIHSDAAITEEYPCQIGSIEAYRIDFDIANSDSLVCYPVFVTSNLI
jgi:hypothetical protein